MSFSVKPISMWHQQKSHRSQSECCCGQLNVCPNFERATRASIQCSACHRLATSLEALRAMICFRSIDLDPTSSTSFSGPHVSALRLRGPQARHSQHVPQLGLRPSQQLTELLMSFAARVRARSRTARYHINARPVATMKSHCNKLLSW